MTHFLSPEGVFAALIIGFLLDYFSVGPDNIRDKIAFLFYLAAIRDGFNGGKADELLLKGIGQAIDLTKKAGNTYLASARTNVIVGMAIWAVAVYTIGCLLPHKWVFKKMGAYTKLEFPRGANKKMNWKLLTCAIVLGLASDQIVGWAGTSINWLINADCVGAAFVVKVLFLGQA